MYGTIAEWRAYALERGDSAPTDASDIEATAALVRASDYIKYKYVARFLSGCDDTHEGVEPATYIAASMELDTPKFFSKIYTPSQQKVLTQAGDIKWTVVGDASGTDAATPRSTMIEDILAKCLPVEDIEDDSRGDNFIFSVGS